MGKNGKNGGKGSDKNQRTTILVPLPLPSPRDLVDAIFRTKMTYATVYIYYLSISHMYVINVLAFRTFSANLLAHI